MITLLDGACGSLLWDMAEKRGVERKAPWMYAVTQPELVKSMHRRYLDAGSDMIQTDTFSVNRDSVAREQGFAVEQVVTAAVKLAREEAEGSNAKVYLSCGPLQRLLQPYGNLTAEECADIYAEIFAPAKAAGVQAIALETFMDLAMMKIAAAEAKKTKLPVFCSMTFEKRHRTMMGDKISDICKALEDLGADAVGMNCSKGPAEGLEIIKEFRETTSLPLYFKPNSGMGENYDELAFAEEIAPAMEFADYIGGCCGTDDRYIRELKRRILAAG